MQAVQLQRASQPLLGQPGRVSRVGSVRCYAALKPRDPKQRTVITGIGLTSCFGNDPDVFYDKYVFISMQLSLRRQLKYHGAIGGAASLAGEQGSCGNAEEETG